MNNKRNICHFNLITLLAIFISCEGAQNPHGVVLNEVFTFGQQRNFFTNKKPYIELSRATNQEVTLDKYSLVVFSVNNRNQIILRAIMDLKTRKFSKEQQFGVIGDGTFPNKIHEAEMRATPGIFFNEQFTSVDYLSVGNQQYLVVILTYSGGELY
jgi:hypothetical protein